MSSNGKVIHVHFGVHAQPKTSLVNDGRTASISSPASTEKSTLNKGATIVELFPKQEPSVLSLSPSDNEDFRPAEQIFTRDQVVKLLQTTIGKLRSLERHKIVEPAIRHSEEVRYVFSDLIVARTALGLTSKGFKLREVARTVQLLKTELPHVSHPLTQLSVQSDGAHIIVRDRNGAYEPSTGQMVLDFDTQTLADDVVRVLHPAVRQNRARLAFDLYRRASQLDEYSDSQDEAEELYRRAIDYDPLLAIAYTNLGNILFRKGDEFGAEAMYAKALSIDSNQPEAKYNLGYLMLERQQLDLAIRYFQGAIDADPRFADAYFNLAMAFEELGDRSRARTWWKNYLDLEPQGQWADIARKHLA